MTATPTCPVRTDFRFTGRGTFPQGLTRYDAMQDASDVHFVQEPGAGYWVVLDRELVLRVLQDPETFSSAAITPLDPDPPVRMIPVQLDPPEHATWRRLLASYFSPRRMPHLEARIREHCAALLDELVPRGEADFVSDFATRFPTVIFLEVMGLPLDELPTFLGWLRDVVVPDADGEVPRDRLFSAMMSVMGRLMELIADRRASPDPEAQDIISHAATWEVDGAPARDEDVLSCCLLLFVAGLDTVAQQLAYTVRHLATHPQDRARAAADPAGTTEEMLRAYSIPELGRKVARDVELGGQLLRAGEMVLLPLCAMNRDPDHVDRGREVVLDRTEPVVHHAFGAGPHRCLGSHLARTELTTFLELWHERVPDYALASDAPLEEYWSSIHGLPSLPLRWEVR